MSGKANPLMRPPPRQFYLGNDEMNCNEFLCTALYFVLGAASPKVREIYDRELDVEKLFESDRER